MKFSHFLLAAGLCSFSTASAQTAPVPTQAPRGTGSAAPSAGISGTAPVASDPKNAVSAGEVFTKGAPNGNKKTMKHKGSMSDGHGKMKTKM